MVVVRTTDAVDVQCYTRALGKTLKAVGNHLCAKVANLLALEAKVDHAEWPVGQVNDRAAESLVERRIGVAEAGEAGGCAEGLGESVPQGYTDVFGCVMVVDVQVSLAGDGQAPAGVFGEGVEHVVEKANTGADADGL